MDGSYTGKDNPIDIVWLDREGHDYSSTKLKTQIFESVHHAMTMEVDYD
jgi:tRNA(Ser,Leu) C12 N-acetylase TAN1